MLPGVTSQGTYLHMHVCWWNLISGVVKNKWWLSNWRQAFNLSNKTASNLLSTPLFALLRNIGAISSLSPAAAGAPPAHLVPAFLSFSPADDGDRRMTLTLHQETQVDQCLDEDKAIKNLFTVDNIYLYASQVDIRISYFDWYNVKNKKVEEVNIAQ